MVVEAVDWLDMAVAQAVELVVDAADLLALPLDKVGATGLTWGCLDLVVETVGLLTPSLDQDVTMHSP